MTYPFGKNVIISSQLRRTQMFWGSDSVLFIKPHFRYYRFTSIYASLSPRFHAAFSPENWNTLALFCFLVLDKTSLVLCLLYKMDQFLNSFAKQLPFNSILFQLQMLCYFLKRIFICSTCSTDCQEEDKTIFLTSFQFIIFSRLLSWIYWI